jgi:hypothetical protein
MNPTLPVGLPAACMKTSGNWTFINFNDNTPDCPFGFGFYVAFYREECSKADCLLAATTTNPGITSTPSASFGFFEATHYRSFSAYMAAVLAMNGSWTYRFDKVNVYMRPTGGRITFVFNADKKEWGIVDYDLGAGPVTPERHYDKWRVADGDIMTSPKDACIIVDNQRLRERLILDHTDVNHPRRAILELPAQECTCPLPDRCISPRGQ